jgi:two-component system, chemotaxis family, chemotaxis protein CheY
MMIEAKKPSVLVVDDDLFMREMLKIILEDGDEYLVVGEASDGQDAIMKCASLNPDLVLLDINMPKMDGLQALEEIHKVSPATMVLMVSADATMGKVREAIQKGAAGFVVKPLNPASVLDRVNKCFKEKGKGWVDW